MHKVNNTKFTELLLLTIIWIILLAAPIFFRDSASFGLNEFYKSLQTLIPLFILFLINRLYLVPVFLLQKKYFVYFTSVVLVIIAFTVASFVFTPSKGNARQGRQGLQNRGMTYAWPYRVNNRPVPLHRGRQGRPLPPYANLFLFSILLVGFDTGLRIAFRMIETEKEKAKLEKEHVGTQLAFLKNQVSPHFFMNTLNNIHALVDINKEEAKESIIQLSKLMRHLLYDSEIEQIPIEKEIEFIKNYIDLMKLRFSGKVRITLKLPEQLPHASIPPLLFTSFLENAFKHGISYRKESYVDIKITYTEHSLNFYISNSNHGGISDEKYSGIGIENSKKRLDLLYGKDYTLHIHNNRDDFSIMLKIPL